MHQQSIVSISLLVKLVEDYKLSASPMLEAAGISLELLQNPKAKISLQQEFDFVREMLTSIDDPNIGFRAGQCYRLNAFGNLGLAAASSEKVNDAIEFFLKYTCLSNTHFDISLTKEGPHAILRFKDQYDLKKLKPFYIERDFSFSLLSTRDLFPRTLSGQKYKTIHFDFECPTTVENYESLFGCQVKFSMPYNEFKFDRKYLDQALPQANQLARKFFEEQCESQKLDTIGPEGYTQKIRKIIRNSEGHLPLLEDIAVHFHATSRTIRRKLKAEGSTYQQLFSEELCRIAIHYLETTNMTIEQIAHKIGYGDSTSFIHAFKRWTNKVPGAYRKR